MWFIYELVGFSYSYYMDEVLIGYVFLIIFEYGWGLKYEVLIIVININ